MIRRQRTVAIAERLSAVLAESTTRDIAEHDSGPRAHCAGAFHVRRLEMARSQTISV